MSEQTEKVNLNGVDYNVSDLTDEQRYFVNQVADVRNQQAQLKFKLDQLVVAENSFAKMLTDSIEKKDAEPVPEAK